ncbi:MAG TPA: PHP domain-containing protein [Candidatus Aminicenantes bacterium]|nr:PHP domain-containing protein [Candidatus Aminicenantes bacterium]
MINPLSILKNVDSGARFYKVDLHIHTPKSYDYDDKSILYESLVKRAIDSGLEMIAITDHNIGTAYEEMKEAAKNTSLIVLPGVEVTVEGVHIIGIFPQKKDSNDITYLLHNLKIKDEDMGKEETISSIELTIPAVLKEIVNAGGVPICAHVGSTKGLTDEIRGIWRQLLIQHKALKIVEISKIEDKKWFDGTDSNYKRKLTCVMGSDAHHPDEIGRRFVWIKMGECSFNALKQIIHEPDLRISLSTPSKAKYPKLIGMLVTGGLYLGEIFHFNENLNAIIGGRGAGKSAIIDFTRFALDYPPRSEEYLEEFYRRITKLLGIGNSVKLFLENQDGKFLIERKLIDISEEKISGKGKKISEISTEEKIFQIVNDNLVETTKTLREIFEIEVFGQGEVFELTKRADNQLKLIDEYIGVEDLYRMENEHLENLNTNSKNIINIISEQKILDEELKELPGLKNEIKTHKGHLEGKIFKNYSLWESEKSYFKEAANNLKSEREIITKRINETISPTLPTLIDDSPNIEEIKQVGKLYQKLFKELKDSREKELILFETIIGEIRKIHNEWKKKFDLENIKFTKKLSQLGVSDQQALLNRLHKLKEKEFKIEKKVKPKYEELGKELVEKIQDREELLKNLKEKRNQIHKKRLDVVAQMSKELEKGDVKIEINTDANRNEFFELLDEVYKGSDIYKRTQQLENICLSMNPYELANFIMDNDFGKLIELSNITEDTAKKIINYPTLEYIYRMEVCPLHDELVIYLKKTEGEEFSPLKDLSYGEKCTAVFSISLLGKEKPLLIDQPEDELDHAFIINNIVEHIRRVKGKRQLVISTHNANIPVLGDAELIFKVAKIPGKLRCKVEERGSFEKSAIINKLQDLEGGKEAFQKRKEKYGL